MTRKARRYFWSDWREASRRRFFRLVPRAVVLASLAVFIGLRLLTGTVTVQIEESKAQYARVLPLVQEIHTLRARQGDLAHLPLRDAVWHIVDDLVAEQNLTSLRETTMDGDDPAIQATLTGLPLNTLARLLRDLRDRAGLQTRDCALTRNPDDPRLGDAHLVLVR
jgi:type II secretory pathway component PulM